jgi:hypothetical protein
MTLQDTTNTGHRTLARIGAIAFALWGILHIAGSAFILAELASGGPAAGYAVYGTAETVEASIAGSILGYLSFLLLAAGVVVAAIALRMNWRNSESGLAMNTGLVLLIEVGLVVFLLFPGHVSMAEAAPGIGLFLIGAVSGGVACKRGIQNGG